MSYRTRRARSRTPPPPRFHQEPSSFRAERTVENTKPSRDRDEPKRERWENDRNRGSGRSRSPHRLSQARNSSNDKRERFESSQFTRSKRSRSNERGKYMEYTAPNSWTREERISKFSPPSTYSPVHFQEYIAENNITTDEPRWISDDLQNPMTFQTTFVEPHELSLNTTNQGGLFQIVTEKEIQAPDVKKEEQGSTIPEFNPETSKLNSQEWIQLIEKTAADRDWKPDEKLYVLTSRLAGYARVWHLNTGIKCSNWADLKQAFFTAFPSENDYFQLLKKMIHRTKLERESLTTYFHHKVALLNACDINGRKAVSCIVGGLPDGELKEDCKWQNFDDPDILYQFLRNYPESTPEKVVSKNVDEKKSSGKKLNANQICFYCKKKGHLVVNCELKMKHMNSNSSFSDIPKSRSTNFNNSSLHVGGSSQKPAYNKYYTEVTINGIPLKGYIDQGSECTTITEDTARMIKLAYTKQYRMVNGFGGHSVSVIGVADTAVRVDRALAKLNVYIVSDHSQAIPIIVGQSFTEQPHVVVMKDGDKVRFYQRLDNGQTNFDF